jgi:hypothetical protein
VNVRIGFPVSCVYRGGIEELGTHGRHLWIEDGRIGHGRFSPSHGIPLSSVAGVEIMERETDGSEAWPMLAQGVYGARRTQTVKPKQSTEIAVRTKDGRTGLWMVKRRGGEWVQGKLALALHEAGISL